MSNINIINQGTGKVIVDGNLTFANIDKKTVKSQQFITSASQVTVDLAQVTNIDSAGLALIIEWLKYARLKNIQLFLDNTPEQLLKLATLSGFDLSKYFAPKSD